VQRPISRRQCFQAGLLVTVGFLLVAVTFSNAQTQERTGSDGGQNSPGTAGVLLLESGRVLEGRIRREGDQYRVQQRLGQIVVSAREVSGVFSNLRDAYRFLRDRVNTADPDEYIDLAYWCVQHKFFTEARECVQQAQQLDPSNASYRRILSQIDRLEAIERQRRQQLMDGHERFLKTRWDFSRNGTAMAISPEAVRYLASRVQPLLTRRCSAVGCHGTHAGSPPQFWPSTSSTVVVANYNLQQLMPYIDFSRPEESPLLQKAITPHGGLRLPPLPLGKQDPSYQTLLRWVRAVAKDAAPASFRGEEDLVGRPGPSESGTPEAAAPGPGVVPALFEETQGGGSPPPRPAASPASPATHSRSSSPEAGSPSGKPELDSETRGSAEGPVDPFDPDLFNEQPRDGQR
jgi:hypothetical protein